MEIDDIREWVNTNFKGVIEKQVYSEITFFYNPGEKLPNGVYFLTIKENDGPHDKASKIDREGIFRVSFKPDPKEYSNIFGKKPGRPPKGGVVDLKYDFTKLDEWMPHPVYAWMGWTMILSPSQDSFDGIRSHIEWAYKDAVSSFRKKAKD